MGVYQDFSMSVTVPAAQVAALAAALREYEENYFFGSEQPVSDIDIVGGTLPLAEGFEDGLEYGYTATGEGDVEIGTGGYGKLSYDSEAVEALYARHGAIGYMEAYCEDEHYRVRWDGGPQPIRSRGVVVFPYDTGDPESMAYLAVLEYLRDGEGAPSAQQVVAALDKARASSGTLN